MSKKKEIIINVNDLKSKLKKTNDLLIGEEITYHRASGKQQGVYKIFSPQLEIKDNRIILSSMVYKDIVPIPKDTIHVGVKEIKFSHTFKK